MAKTDFRSVDEYIASQPEAAQGLLKRVRITIRRAVPGTVERISKRWFRSRWLWLALLFAMMNLGLPREECLGICSTGLNQKEDYYRIQAARLLTLVSDKHSVNELDLDALIHDREVGVRVYAAKIHWQKNRQAHVVVPVLIEALNRSRHQSYKSDSKR
jgi:hypothetical protein